MKPQEMWNICQAEVQAGLQLLKNKTDQAWEVEEGEEPQTIWKYFGFD